MRSHQVGVEAHRHQLGAGAVVLDVGLEDRVEHLVGRQGLVVALVGAQLGRGRLGEHVLGDERPSGPGVAVAAQLVDQQSWARP